MKVLAISPHLDDAILSAGQYLASLTDATIVTVFAGEPTDGNLLTPYDEKMGFHSSSIAMKMRQLEDKNAAKSIGARWIHMSFLDGQYLENEQPVAELASFLMNLIEKENPDIILGPAGLQHPDHIAVRRILNVLREHTHIPIYLWADLPNRVTNPGSVWDVVQGLETERPPTDHRGHKHGSLQGRKLRACQMYRSQWGDYDIIEKNIMVQEQFWRLA